MATKQKKPGNKVAVFALIEPEQKAALEEIGRRDERSLGYLVRDAIAMYLANAKKKP